MLGDGNVRAFSQVRKYLIPDSNDEIRQEQMREMELISTNGDVIDSLKQAANPAQLILHSFPGQVAFHEEKKYTPERSFFIQKLLSRKKSKNCAL